MQKRHLIMISQRIHCRAASLSSARRAEITCPIDHDLGQGRRTPTSLIRL